MRNASCAFGFLTQNSRLGERCVLNNQKHQEMLFKGIGKKYTADLILLTKFKKIIGIQETFAQNMEVQVSLMEFLLQTQGNFAGFFYFKFYTFRWSLGEQDFEALSFGFQLIKLEIRMCYCECVSEYASVNVFPVCFQ